MAQFALTWSAAIICLTDLCNFRFELPSCIGEQFLTIQKYFDELDTLVVSLVIDLAGPGNTTWTSPEDQKDHSISEKYFKVNKGIPTRRLYLYFSTQGPPSCLFQEENECEPEFLCCSSSQG